MTATRNLRSTREARVRAGAEAEVRVKSGGPSTASLGPGPGTRKPRRARAEGGAGLVAGRASLKKGRLVTRNGAVPTRAEEEEANEVDPAVFIGDTVQVVQTTGLQEGTMLKCLQRREIRELCSACNSTLDLELGILRSSFLKLARCEM